MIANPVPVVTVVYPSGLSRSPSMGAVLPTRTRRIVLVALVTALVAELAFLAVSRLIAAGPLPAGCGFVPVALVNQLVPGGQAHLVDDAVWSRLCEWKTSTEMPDPGAASLRVHVYRCHQFDHHDHSDAVPCHGHRDDVYERDHLPATACGVQRRRICRAASFGLG